MIIILTEKVLKIVNTISLTGFFFVAIDFYTSHADYSKDNNVAVCCCLTNYTKPHHDTNTTTWSWCKSWPEYKLCQLNILSSALQYKVTWYQQPTGTNMALCMYIYANPLHDNPTASSLAKCPIRSLSSTPWRI